VISRQGAGATADAGPPTADAEPPRGSRQAPGRNRRHVRGGCAPAPRPAPGADHRYWPRRRDAL